MTNDQGFIARARREIFELQRRRAVQKRREKLEQSEEAITLELFLDTAKAEGLDPEDPAHLAIIIRAWALRQGEELPSDDGDMERDHRSLNF